MIRLDSAIWLFVPLQALSSHSLSPGRLGNAFSSPASKVKSLKEAAHSARALRGVEALAAVGITLPWV